MILLRITICRTYLVLDLPGRRNIVDLITVSLTPIISACLLLFLQCTRFRAGWSRHRVEPKVLLTGTRTHPFFTLTGQRILLLDNRVVIFINYTRDWM